MSCAKASAYKVRKLQLKFICSVQTCKNQSLSRDKLKGQSVTHLTLLACLCIFHRDWENPKGVVRLQPASQGPCHQSHRDHLWVSQGVSCIFHSFFLLTALLWVILPEKHSEDKSSEGAKQEWSVGAGNVLGNVPGGESLGRIALEISCTRLNCSELWGLRNWVGCPLGSVSH